MGRSGADQGNAIGASGEGQCQTRGDLPEPAERSPGEGSLRHHLPADGSCRLLRKAQRPEARSELRHQLCLQHLQGMIRKDRSLEHR